MKLIKWEPLGEMNNFFNDNVFPSLSRLSRFGSDLAVDVYEEKDKVIAKMTLPGVKSEELDVSIDRDLLTVSGEREEEQEVKEKDYYSKEIHRGSFSRSVKLPKSVETGKVEAEYKDGILMITMPIVPGAKDTSVKVKIKK